MRKLVSASLLVAFLLPLAGCGLSPEQAAALSRYEKAVAEVESRLGSYERKIAEVVEKVRAKEIPAAEAQALLAEIGANYEADKERLGELKASVKDLKKNEVPWWYYLGPIVTGILGLLGGRVPGWRTQRVLGAVVDGVEHAGDASVKECIRDSAELHGVGPELHRIVRKLG